MPAFQTHLQDPLLVVELPPALLLVVHEVDLHREDGGRVQGVAGGAQVALQRPLAAGDGSAQAAALTGGQVHLGRTVEFSVRKYSVCYSF